MAAAHGANDILWAGAEYSNYLTDFGPSQRTTRFGAYTDLNLTSRLGIEGELRFLRLNGFNGESQGNYLAGPRITVFRREKFVPYVKVLAGIAQDNFPFKIGTGSYLALAPGGGFDYRLSRRIAFRVEYEYQLWPAAPGVSSYPSNGMTPSGFSAGFAYRLFGK